MDGHALPHEAILEGLRPILRRPERASARRRRSGCSVCLSKMFCSPAPAPKKQKAAIARTSVLPVWYGSAAPWRRNHAQAFVADLRALILRQKLPEAATRAAQFWTFAGV